jgi:hypothetical protein
MPTAGPAPLKLDARIADDPAHCSVSAAMKSASSSGFEATASALETPQRIVALVRLEMTVHRQPSGRAHEQRVPIRCGLCHPLATDVSASTGTVLDEDGLDQAQRKPLGEDARHQIGGAAGRERHHDRDLALG